jgi:hypothetical protein
MAQRTDTPPPGKLGPSLLDKKFRVILLLVGEGQGHFSTRGCSALPSSIVTEIESYLTGPEVPMYEISPRVT